MSNVLTAFDTFPCFEGLFFEDFNGGFPLGGGGGILPKIFTLETIELYTIMQYLSRKS